MASQTVSRGVAARIRAGTTVDRQAVYLAALMAIVNVAAVVVALYFSSQGQTAQLGGAAGEAASSGGADGAAAGGAWVTVEVLAAVAVLALALLYERLPAVAKKIIKWNVIVVGSSYIGASMAIDGVYTTGIVYVVVPYLTAIIAIDHFDIWWLLNDALVLVVAITFAVVAGMVFGVPALLVGLAGLTIYDHVFANKNEYMFQMSAFMLRLRLPVIFIKPERWRLDWEQLYEDIDEDDDAAPVSWGIGTADLALPGGLAVAAAIATPSTASLLVAAGVIAGATLACFRLRYELVEHGSGAGLPAIFAGAVGGWVVVQVPVWIAGNYAALLVGGVL